MGTKFDSVTFSMNGTFISVCVSSQTDSWANLYRVKKPLIAEWKKEIALRPITPSPPPSPEALETEADVETQENNEEIQEPEPEPTPPPKWKPNISYLPAPFKFKKPKTTVAPMKSNFIDLKANVDQVADVTGDDSMYLMTEEMKEKRNELEHRKFQQFFPSGHIPDPGDLEIQLNAATMAFVLEPFDKLQPVAGVDSHLTSRTGSGKTSRHQIAVAQGNATKV